MKDKTWCSNSWSYSNYCEDFKLPESLLFPFLFFQKSVHAFLWNFATQNTQFIKVWTWGYMELAFRIGNMLSKNFIFSSRTILGTFANEWFTFSLLHIKLVIYWPWLFEFCFPKASIIVLLHELINASKWVSTLAPTSSFSVAMPL